MRQELVRDSRNLSQFARLAGAVEILEEQFLQLRNARDALIDAQKERFKAGLVARDSLDSVKMIVLLERSNSQSRLAGAWQRRQADRLSRKATRCVSRRSDGKNQESLQTPASTQKRKSKRSYTKDFRASARVNDFETGGDKI